MGWLSFIQSKDFDPSSFEKELSTLARKITRNERNIEKYRYQQQKLRNIFIIYGSGGYLAYDLYLLISNGLDINSLDWPELGFIFLLPVAIVMAFRVVQVLYNIRISRVQAYVELLKNQHSEKIDELKEKTQFSSTQALLQRFSDGADLNAQVDEELFEKQKQLEEIKASLQPGNPNGVFHAYPSTPKSWLDTIVDSVVGSDELNPSNRYALICANCSSHNGLAPPNQLPETVRYKCPHCGFVNGLVLQSVSEQGEEVNVEEQNTEHTEKKGAIEGPATNE